MSRMQNRRSMVLGVVTAALLAQWPFAFAIGSDAEARQSRARAGVVACSRYGNGCVAASVRRGRLADEMLTKRGRRIDCRGDCRETLREETVDFWETQNDKAKVFGF
ncbi:MAG: hypothetical protein ACT4N2_14640 [Hyphomicrobium sp.]